MSEAVVNNEFEDEPAAAFTERARSVIDAASTAPWPLRDGRTVIPRRILADLAEVAARAPVTGQELDYTYPLRECFDALATGDHGGDPAGHPFILLLAMTSLDRGGHVRQADACVNAWDYMASLPAWSEADVSVKDDGSATLEFPG